MPGDIYLVCSPQPRVGTTTIARLLAEYHLWRGRILAVYDTDAHGRELSALMSTGAVIVDLSRTQGQMALFDALLSDSAGVRVVDVCARSYRDFFHQARRLAVFEEARRLGLRLNLLFVTDLAPAALTSLSAIAKTWPDLSPIVITNEGASPLMQSFADGLPNYPAERTFEIGALAAPSARWPKLPGTPLREVLLGQPGTDPHNRLRGGMTRAFIQFRCHELREMLAGLP